MHERQFSLKANDWFSITILGSKVDLSVNGTLYGTIIDDATITLGGIYPCITFGAADGDRIEVLPVDKPLVKGATKGSTKPPA